MLLLIVGTWAGSTGAAKVGWMPEWGSGLRHDPAELERRLEQQRGRTFNRQRFDEILVEARDKVAEVKSKPAKAELRRAVEAVAEAVEASPNDELTAALEAAILAKTTAGIIREAQAAYNLAMAALDDEEEEIALLMSWNG